jgi:uncharacterized protein (TIGR03437 family)
LLGIANSAATRVSGITTPLELISLYGSGIGPTMPLTAQIQNIGPGNQNVVTNSLGGYQVLFNGVAAPLLYVSASQINAIVPASAGSAPTTTIQIVTPNGTIAGPTLRVRPSQPQVFGAMYAGSLNFAAAINQDGTLNSQAHPAALGSIVTVWATGAGLYSANHEDGAILGPCGPAYLYCYNDVSIPLPVSVLTTIQDVVQTELVSVQVPYAGAAPNAVQGVLQINFVVTGSFTYQLQIDSGISDPFGSGSRASASSPISSIGMVRYSTGFLRRRRSEPLSEIWITTASGSDRKTRFDDMNFAHHGMQSKPNFNRNSKALLVASFRLDSRVDFVPFA